MLMDLNQMHYFVKIVEADFNLTLTSQKIHVSQPALSQFIKNIEENEQIELFTRNNNRLTGLTPAGRIIYRYATEILSKNDDLLHAVRQVFDQQQIIRFGASSSFLRLLFIDFFPNFALDHPRIQIDMVEDGFPELYKQFKGGTLDFAILVEPTDFDSDFAKEQVIFQDQLAAFIAFSHPLSTAEKITWKEIADYPIITFPQNFCIFRKINNYFQKYGLQPRIIESAPSWEYLMESVVDNNAVTLLPSGLPRFVTNKKVCIKFFQEPVTFNIVLVQSQQSKNPDACKILADAIATHLLVTNASCRMPN
ncbi:transcriptional regulator, LysR family [Enterococcus casseliflavus]|uniref:LysR family transcriptional regulator n=1 Tax=Enterococcus casseliflavus TaxID=37734 RepID=UPI0008EE737C|nr:LysR family transcriptional regulator [Enterococcus casseliflavus]GEB28730.1 LysR family transcriptional regulator [Enterococcus casseliflavus]SFD46030.1 DNA-binding transcriptional regulator, LysR family [Enterococcus casseliflavus]STP33472.1 transcriptional regulator, LysR family [Enterococcus casseliflavus]